jgi:hypothetical protein
MPPILSTLLAAPLAANPSVLDGTWHLVAVEEDGQAVAPGTAILTVRRGRFDASSSRQRQSADAPRCIFPTADCCCRLLLAWRRPTAWKTGP